MIDSLIILTLKSDHSVEKCMLATIKKKSKQNNVKQKKLSLNLQ